mmetsp:Transcript_50718/g.158872  ORF Transcript_50718/g.158872 Transcript_50718/m.158872 type:complete len:339 (+) Transcript_50718:85-1101(+)
MLQRVAPAAGRAASRAQAAWRPCSRSTRFWPAGAPEPPRFWPAGMRRQDFDNPFNDYDTCHFVTGRPEAHYKGPEQVLGDLGSPAAPPDTQAKTRQNHPSDYHFAAAPAALRSRRPPDPDVHAPAPPELQGRRLPGPGGLRQGRAPGPPERPEQRPAGLGKLDRAPGPPEPRELHRPGPEEHDHDRAPAPPGPQELRRPDPGGPHRDRAPAPPEPQEHGLRGYGPGYECIEGDWDGEDGLDPADGSCDDYSEDDVGEFKCPLCDEGLLFTNLRKPRDCDCCAAESLDGYWCLKHSTLLCVDCLDFGLAACAAAPAGGAGGPARADSGSRWARAPRSAR